MSEDSRELDATRLCPTCRMPISILAVRCRYCGANVGRPRKEQAELTVEDLGGERQSNYTLSGNVMDALEAFRAEEQTQRELELLQKKQAGTWFGRKNKDDQDKITRLRSQLDDGLPSLDPLNSDLSFDSSFSPSSKSVPRRPAGSGITRKLFLFASVSAGLVLLAFFTNLAYGRIRQYLDEKNKVPERPNRAQEMLNEGRPSIEALEEAATAYNDSNSEKNKDILQLVRTVFLREIDQRMNEPEYSRATLDEASKLINRALASDPDEMVRAKHGAVQQELAAHNMQLVSISDGSGGKRLAQVRVQQADMSTKTEQVADGDKIQGRFLVTMIKNDAVLLKDEQRGNRALRLHVTLGLMKN